MTQSFRRLAPALAMAMPLGAAADDAPARWPQFHGPGGNGIAEGKQAAPVEFGPEKGLLWKTPLPVGHSSPAIWGERIFLTGFRPEEKRLETLCLDRASGRILWRRPVPAESIEPVHEVSNPAAPSPVTDGKAVFVYFGSYGLVAYDFEGRERWRKPLPMVKTFMNQGSGTSPILAGDRLLAGRAPREGVLPVGRSHRQRGDGLEGSQARVERRLGHPRSSGGRARRPWSASSTQAGSPPTVSVTAANGGGSATFPGRPAPRPSWATESSSWRERNAGGKGQRHPPSLLRRDARPLRSEQERPHRGRRDPGDAAGHGSSAPARARAT